MLRITVRHPRRHIREYREYKETMATTVTRTHVPILIVAIDSTSGLISEVATSVDRTTLDPWIDLTERGMKATASSLVAQVPAPSIKWAASAASW